MFVDHREVDRCNVFIVTGDQAKCFFVQSGLPTQTLGQIWLVTSLNEYSKLC